MLRRSARFVPFSMPGIRAARRREADRFAIGGSRCGERRTRGHLNGAGREGRVVDAVSHALGAAQTRVVHCPGAGADRGGRAVPGTPCPAARGDTPGRSPAHWPPSPPRDGRCARSPRGTASSGPRSSPVPRPRPAAGRPPRAERALGARVAADRGGGAGARHDAAGAAPPSAPGRHRARRGAVDAPGDADAPRGPLAPQARRPGDGDGRRIVVPSLAVADDLAGLFPAAAERVRVVGHGVTELPVPPDAAARRRRHGAPRSVRPGHRDAGAAQGLDVLVQAMARTWSRTCPWR